MNMMKPIALLCLLTVCFFISCEKEKEKEQKKLIGLYNVTNYGSSGGPGGLNSGPWEYQLRVDRHGALDDDYLALQNFVNINAGNTFYQIKMLLTSSTTFEIPMQNIEGSGWISKYKFTAGMGHFSGDSIYYEYSYVNDIGDPRWGSGVGVKIKDE